HAGAPRGPRPALPPAHAGGPPAARPGGPDRRARALRRGPGADRRPGHRLRVPGLRLPEAGAHARGAGGAAAGRAGVTRAAFSWAVRLDTKATKDHGGHGRRSPSQRTSLTQVLADERFVGTSLRAREPARVG